MAIIRWISQDGAWDAGGSWSTGSVPGSIDTAQFDGTSQVSVTSGHTSGVADFKNLVTTDLYSGDIGAFGSELTCTVSNRIVHRGSGFLAFKFNGGAVSGGGQYTIIDSRSAGVSAFVDSNGNGINFVVKAGHLQVLGTTASGYSVTPESSTPAILESIDRGTGVVFTRMFNRGGIILGQWDGSADDIYVQVSGTSSLSQLDMASSRMSIFGGYVSIGPLVGTGVNQLLGLDIYGGVVDFSQLSSTFLLGTLIQYGGEVIRSDYLSLTTERDLTRSYPDF